MSDFNMPPGVSSNDIPGNTPEDRENERFWELLDKMFVDQHGEKAAKWLTLLEDPDPDDMIFEYVKLARDIGYNKGYENGCDDTERSREG